MRAPLILILLICAYLAIFIETRFDLFRIALRCQVDLLPPLMIFASLRMGMMAVVALAVTGGLLVDCLSANPLGISMLSLFLVGWTIQANGAFLLGEQRYAQFILGIGASLAVPLISLALLANLQEEILFSPGLFWGLAVNAIAGGVLTPVICRFLEILEKVFSYQQVPEPGFRADREIKRGK
jgi:rod shape-determining protein MreD